MVVSGAGALSVNHADSLKEADPARDVLAYEALGVLLVALGVIAFFLSAMGGIPDGFEARRAAGSALSWLRGRFDSLVVRESLYFGIFGGLGATLGWFVWVAVAILVAHPRDVWVSAVVGATIGAALDGARRYREAARRNPDDELAPVSAENRQSGPHQATPPNRSRLHWIPFFGLAFTTLGVLLGAAAEQSVGDLIKEVRFPFLFSMLTYSIGGIGVGVAARLTKDMKGLSWVWFLVLMLPGAVIGLLLSLVNLLTGTNVEIESLVAWWAVITAVGAIAITSAHQSPWRAAFIGIAAIAVVALVVLSTSLIPFEKDDAETQRHPQVRALMHLAVSISESMLTAPDIPAASWTAADAKLQATGSDDLIKPGVPPVASQWLADVEGCSHIPTRPDPDNPARLLARKHELCTQLVAATGSSWTRSAIVLFLFWLGLITATRVERRWRPANYEIHTVRRADRLALTFVTTGLLVGLLVLGLTGAMST